MEDAGGGVDGSEMGGMSGDGSGGTNGQYGIGMESSDDDSPSAALKSMGYVDKGAKMGGVEGAATSSELSILQKILLVLVAVFGVYVVYSVITGILALFGVQL